MRTTLAPLFLGVLISLVPACAIVPRYQRESIIDPAMDPASDGLAARSFRKFHGSREGAAGGDGLPAGGGCGCGQ